MELQPDDLLDRLRAGDRAAFAGLVDGWSPALLRVARLHVSTAASAEEVVQETWLAVIGQLDRFEGQSSLRTWVFRILENVARGRGRAEARALPLPSAFPDDAGPTVDPARFRGVAAEPGRQLGDALAELPARQRTVVELRDVHGLSSAEVCEQLQITDANQRILLHRGRGRLRARLEETYRGRERTG